MLGGMVVLGISIVTPKQEGSGFNLKADWGISVIIGAIEFSPRKSHPKLRILAVMHVLSMTVEVTWFPLTSQKHAGDCADYGQTVNKHDLLKER